MTTQLRYNYCKIVKLQHIGESEMCTAVSLLHRFFVVEKVNIHRMHCVAYDKNSRNYKNEHKTVTTVDTIAENGTNFLFKLSVCGELRYRPTA